ncbi:DUF4178 domain-containing protein [Chitinophaga oryzae]|uniref:DUF4178 domain-containing protein n=1 Tax=Chitinophaga oryzae TaxID=2725414 RepID=A0ABX6LRQ5_9BACT|nr:DUF4178 domain-containing protein [Chitinophaga oryzae]QJB42380.1 DUF4178 domain-containing protein [Chitinophaga oryzae]
MSDHFPSSFNCPACQRHHHLFDAEKTQMYVCGKCHTVIEAGPRGLFAAYKLHRPKGKPKLQTWQRGTLNGHAYTVIAVAERYEVNTPYSWFEYTLLRDNDHQLAYLSSYDGHWNFLEPLPDHQLPQPASKGGATGLTVNDRFFERFSAYKANYRYAEGEFHWLDNLQKSKHCEEFIRPPQLLAEEREADYQQQKDYYLGTYIQREEISQSFLKGGYLPAPVGVAPAQPARFNVDAQRFLKGTLVFCILALIIQTVYSFNSKKVPVFSDRIYLDTANVSKPVVSPSFKLEGKTSNLEVQLETDVDNSWCEVEVNLVNEQTGKETAFVVGAEFYSGVSEGESWSEGSRMQKEFVCSVPEGSYHFVTTFSKGDDRRPVNIGLTAWWDVPSWWNAVLLSVLMTIVAVIIWAIRRSFEARRWAGSNL